MIFDAEIARLDASLKTEARLLLQTARAQFDSDRLDVIQTLVEGVNDWDFVSETAIDKFSAPYLLRALKLVNSEAVPARIYDRLRKFTEYTRLRALKMAAAQIEFHRTCIEPGDISHVYVKGMMFPMQFGGNFTERFSRDIDVLVAENQFEDVVTKAANAGYRILLSVNPLKYVTSKDDLAFAIKYSVEVLLINREGIVIEVHRRLDKSSAIFDSKIALETAETVHVSGIPMKTLQETLHFVYVCYHHSRHLWSRLHWLADLDLVLRSSSYSSTEMQDAADAFGLRPTVVASIGFYHRSSQSSIWYETQEVQKLEDIFLQACLLNLNGDPEVEVELRRSFFSTDLVSKDQIAGTHQLKNTISNLASKFRPVPSQYVERPLPAHMFWLYRLQRPFLSLGAGHAKPSSKTIFDDTQISQKKIAKRIDD